MPNINKVVFGNQTLIDLSTTTLSSTDQLESGVTAYDRAGNVITGTSTGTGAGGITQDQDGYLVLDDDAPPGTPTLISKTITENGTYDAEDDNADGYSSVTVNVASGGVEYEEGTWTPVNDTDHGTILFQNTHTEAPAFYAVCDVSSDSISDSEVLACVYGDLWKLFGAGYPYMNGGTYYRYAIAAVPYVVNSAATGQMVQMGRNSDDSSETSDNCPRYWAKETGIYPGAGNSVRYWKGGRTYKWFAIWKPST